VVAKFKIRANNQWIDGGHNRTALKNPCDIDLKAVT
jgi:hypothetical protein